MEREKWDERNDCGGMDWGPKGRITSVPLRGDDWTPAQRAGKVGTAFGGKSGKKGGNEP